MVNALREVDGFHEITVHLQSNEVHISTPADVGLGQAYDAIAAAGYTPDNKVWLTAYGSWTEAGFQPEGWSQALPATRPEEVAHDGPWTLLFERADDGWSFREASPAESVRQVVPKL